MATVLQPASPVTAPRERLFHVAVPARRPLTRTLASWVTRPLNRWTHLSRLQALYEQLPPAASPQAFCDAALSALGVRYDVTDEDLARIPASGPLCIVANHPFGAVEGLALASLVSRVRPDFKFMANYLLARIPELRDMIIGVDPFGQAGAMRRNLGPLRECLQQFRRGGVLGVFPAGEVAHLHLTRSPRVTDPRWSPNVAGMIQRAEVPVLPVYFSGANSVLFQLLGLLHPRLRTAMLARELMNKNGCQLPVHIGPIIPLAAIRNYPEPVTLTAYLRFRTFVLKHRPASRGRLPQGGTRPRFLKKPLRQAVLAPAMPADLLEDEIHALPPAQMLLATEEMAVHWAAAAQIPEVLRELGRLRELTFRAVGEGTGRPLDLDRFDQHYRHLFVWHRSRREVVGAYRLGAVDEITTRHGVNGLYTHTLFRYRLPDIQRLGPTLELGRSFVRAEYQRSFAPLLLLWKGIGALIAAQPHYRYLLGPVSISNDYQNYSRQMLATFLQTNCLPALTTPRATPRRPVRLTADPETHPRQAASLVRDVDEIGALLSDIEPDGKGIPVLLRQYLKLGGRILGCNVDPAFGYAIDALILVDLAQTEKRILEKYLGREGAERFLACHGHTRHQPTDSSGTTAGPQTRNTG